MRASNAGLPMSLHPTLTAQGIGTVVMTRHYAEDGRTAEYITVDSADPHIEVYDELLSEISQNRADVDQVTGETFYAENFRTGIRLEPSPKPRLCGNGCTYPSHPFCWTDWLLHIDGRNQHLVYRLTEFNLERNTWRASWPD